MLPIYLKVLISSYFTGYNFPSNTCSASQWILFFLNQQYIVVKVETVLETAKVILEATIHSLQHADAL